jgi:hypothetical protein
VSGHACGAAARRINGGDTMIVEDADGNELFFPYS